MTTAHPHVLTIGHSNHEFDEFKALLQTHGVTAVADVRSAPYSRFAPQFNKEPLQRALNEADVKYVFLGRELGARSEDPSCYDDKGRVQYARLARTEPFQAGIERVLSGATTESIALMCTEKDPLDCHRTLLVAHVLAEQGVNVDHIHPHGDVEPHGDAMLRLLDRFRLPHVELFRSTEELVEQARSRQEERIAYVDERLATAAAEQVVR